MTKWLLVWVVAGVGAASLPDGQMFDSEEACKAAANTIRKLGGTRLAGNTMTIDADCIEVHVPDPAE